MSMPFRAAVAALVLTVLAAPSADAQSWLEKAKKKAREKAAEVVDKSTEKTPERPADKAADAVATPAASTGAAATATPAASPGEAATALRPGEGAWANYDFKPGDRPIFVDDFTKDEVGDFPRRMEFKSGNIEIVKWSDARWLRSGSGGELLIPLPETLPERFTMEFDLAGSGNAMAIKFSGEPSDGGNRITINTWQASLYSGDVRAEGELPVKTDEHPVRISILVDGRYVKAYANERRVINVPNADLGRSNKIYIHFNGWSAEAPRMIAGLRIMAGGKKLYDALSESGRVATQGIYFDTGSDRIRAESTPTLKEIGAMLTEHADLKLTIEGHTDDVGAAAANQTLSEKRAEAVKAFLVKTYGVDASRIAAKGLGSTKPAVQGTTPEARQQNRRVELVKM